MVKRQCRSIIELCMERGKWKDQDIVHFAGPLSEIIAGGMSLRDALMFLSTQFSKRIRMKISALILSIESGLSFSESLNQVGAPSFFVFTIMSSEENNQLANALKNIHQYYEERINWRRKWQQIIIYPSFIMITIGISFIFLLTTVIPHFSSMYESMNITIPTSMERLLRLGEFIKSYGLIILLAVCIIVIATVYVWNRNLSFRRNMLMKFIYFPLIGDWMKLRYTQYTAYQMGFLLNSHIPLLVVVRLLEQHGAMILINEQMTTVKQRLLAGERLHESVKDGVIFRNDFLKVIQIGDNAGNLSNMLLTYGNGLQTLTHRQLLIITKFMEPFLILGIGLFIGLIVILLFTPIFGMINQL